MSTFKIFTLTGATGCNHFEHLSDFPRWKHHSLPNVVGHTRVKPINLYCILYYTWTNLYGMVHISIRSGDMTTTCLVESTNYVRLCCLYIYVVEQHRCSSDCFFFHFVAHAGVSRQTWRLAQLLGKYSMCIVLGPFQKGIKAKRKSATNPPQWIHIPLLCFFVWFVFLVVASLLPHLPCLLPSSLDWIFMSFFMCIFLYVCRFMFLVSLPCPPCSPPSFLSVLAWHGTHDAGQTCCNIFYLHCVGPLSGRNHTKKEGASNLSEFILRSFPLIVSCLAV